MTTQSRFRAGLEVAFASLIFFVAVDLAAARAADAHADFTGTWAFNKASSDPPLSGAEAQGPFGPGALFTETPESPVKITQSATEVTIEGPGGNRVTYKLDGSESKNSGPRGEMVSTSRWRKSTLETRFSQTISTPRGPVRIDLIECRSLSANGRSMLVEVSRNTPRGSRSRRLIFDKQP